MRSKADETFVIVETLICPLQISHRISLSTLVMEKIKLQSYNCSVNRNKQVYASELMLI